MYQQHWEESPEIDHGKHITVARWTHSLDYLVHADQRYVVIKAGGGRIRWIGLTIFNTIPMIN